MGRLIQIKLLVIDWSWKCIQQHLSDRCAKLENFKRYKLWSWALFFQMLKFVLEKPGTVASSCEKFQLVPLSVF